MNICFNESLKTFKLDNENITYMMKVIDGGFLTHLYFGNYIDSDDIDYVLFNVDRAFSGNPMKGAGFSLDNLPLEYSAFGTGDFRTAAISLELENGSTATDLRYVSHKIYGGKPKLQGLPVTYGNEKECQTLEVVMEDYYSKVQVILLYTIFEKHNAITRSCIVRNVSDQSIKIRKIMSGCIDFKHCDFEFLHLYGRHAGERNVERIPLFHGKQVVDSLRGASSHQHNPFIALLEPGTSEFSGQCYGFNLVYSGNFICEAEVDQFDTTRMIIGINPTDFAWLLNTGEEFTTPEVVMVYSDNGLSAMSNTYHKLYRDNLCRSQNLKNTIRPVLINNWEATYFDFNEEKLVSIAEEASKLGINMLVMDDGWFGIRNDDTTGLGDWYVNESKIRGGLKKLVDAVNQLGLRFGIWFEPEMVSEESTLYKKHPDWCLEIWGRNKTVSRNQLVLDMSRKDVEDYIFERMCDILDSANIEYVKWDMNRHLTEVGSNVLPANRQKEVWHRYVLGVYSLLERLTSRFPQVLFEGCSGGGGRFDPGMLYYTSHIWTSDNTDAIERLKIQYGTSLVYPITSMGSHVSNAPNHQTGRVTSMRTRGLVAFAGTFGYEIDLTKLSQDEKNEIKNQVETYQRYYDIINYGEYYRLANPLNSNISAWCFVSDDKKEILFEAVHIRSTGNQPFKYIKIPCADESKKYYELYTGKVYTGGVLKNIGICLVTVMLHENGYFASCGDGLGFLYDFIEIE